MSIKECASNGLCFNSKFYFTHLHSPVISRILPKNIMKHSVSHFPVYLMVQNWFELVCLEIQRMDSQTVPREHQFLLFAHRIIHRARRPMLSLCWAPATLSAPACDVFFQDGLSQYSKVLQQQEVVKVARRPVNICRNRSLAMRIVSIQVWVIPFVLRPPHRSPRRHTGASPRQGCKNPTLHFTADTVARFFQAAQFPQY